MKLNYQGIKHQIIKHFTDTLLRKMIGIGSPRDK